VWLEFQPFPLLELALQMMSLSNMQATNQDFVVAPGALDGITIMRYAHVYRDRVSGGVEQYLRHLDHGLLQRHRLTVLQMHLTRGDKNDTVEVENVGMGRILWVPVPVRQMDPTLADLPERISYIVGRTQRLYQQQGANQHGARVPAMWNVLQHHGGHLRHKTTILSDHLSRLLVTQNIDLLSLHWLSYDTGALIARAREAGIPFVFINHFDNSRLPLAQTRKEIAHAAAVGVVSDQSIPEDLRERCVNLSDAVDTEFFNPEKAQPAGRPERPVILLPARIQEGKGHRDLIEAARILLAKSADFVLCFVGAVDSEPLHRELREFVRTTGMEQRTLFLGERSAEEIRDWYAKSSLVVLPSYSEGLPRIVLEAQAMEKPVVAYDSGGTGKAVLANETACLIKAGDINALAAQIDHLLHDEAARVRIGQRGREFVSRKFSVTALIQRHEVFYLNALSGARERSKSSTPSLEYVRHRNTSYAPTQPCSDAASGECLVSILIPAYNAEEWIADTIRSAMAQIWQRKEIIVVDDGSTDQTLAIAREFESDNVRVFEQKNQGAAAARNKAFSLCHGDYIQWLDADDLLAPDKIARQMNELDGSRNKRGLLSSSWGLFMYRHYRAEFIPTALWCDLSPIEWLLAKMGQNLYMQSASWLVSRELTEAAGPWDTRLLSDDDGEYFCRVLMASDGVRFVPEAKVYYRGPGLAFRSLSYIGRSTRKLDAHWLSMQLHIGYLRSLEDSERVRAACLRYLQTSLIYFYPEKRDIVKQAELMAIDLGGELGLPSLSWKYSWMKTILGWRRAKHGQQLLLSFRWWLERVSDKALFRIEGRKPVAHFRNLRVEDKTL
jgi:glycosyltransferase involved in cell wall biosynthesis